MGWSLRRPKTAPILSAEIRLHCEYRLVGRVGEGWAVQAERFYRVLRLAVDRELAQDLADEARELETVACPVEDEDLGLLRQRAENELAIGGHVVEQVLE